MEGSTISAKYLIHVFAQILLYVILWWGRISTSMYLYHLGYNYFKIIL